jgi:TRAP-type mannitol/chloroaromatic compound transport system permease small subunit
LGRWLQGCTQVSRWLAWVGGAALLLSAVLISVDVTTRALWKIAYLESFELSTYAFAIATTMGLSYALVSKAHVRIEVVYVLFPARVRAWFDVFAYSGLSLVVVTLLYWCAQTFWGNVQSGARSNSSLALPLMWPQGLWLLGIAWIALLSTLLAARGLWLCLRGRAAEAHGLLGVATLQEEIDAGGGGRLEGAG